MKLPLAPPRARNPVAQIVKIAGAGSRYPIKLPRIELPLVVEPVSETPSRKLPEIVLRSLTLEPPIVLFLDLPRYSLHRDCHRDCACCIGADAIVAD